MGELISQIPRSLYLYEPCRSLSMTFDDKARAHFGPPPQEAQCRNLVARLLTCTITDTDSQIFRDWVAIMKTNQDSIKALAPKSVPLGRKVAGYNAACAKSSVRIIKEIRLTAPGEDLMNRDSFKVLHLVRDVRAVVNSR